MALKRQQQQQKKNKKDGASGAPAEVQWVGDLAFLCGGAGLIPGLVQWVVDPALLQLWCGSQLQLRFNSWPGELPYASGWAGVASYSWNREEEILLPTFYLQPVFLYPLLLTCPTPDILSI